MSGWAKNVKSQTEDANLHKGQSEESVKLDILYKQKSVAYSQESLGN